MTVVWYDDKVRGEKLLAAMIVELNAIEDGAHPRDLYGWAASDVHTLLDCWLFTGNDQLPGGVRVRWHEKHPELDVQVPDADPVGYTVVGRVVRRVQELITLERGSPFQLPKGSP